MKYQPPTANARRRQPAARGRRPWAQSIALAALLAALGAAPGPAQELARRAAAPAPAPAPIVAASSVLAPAPARPAAPAASVPDDKQRLAVGDKVTFRVVEDQEDAKTLVVTDSGEILVPELGLVPAADKSCKQLAGEIKARLEQTTYYRATVILGLEQLNQTVSGRKVFVVGQVRQTGPQEIPAGQTWTVSKVILRAGGFTDFADRKHVRLVRAGGKDGQGRTLMVNVKEIFENAKTSEDIPVEPEDLIYVPGRAVNFY